MAEYVPRGALGNEGERLYLDELVANDRKSEQPLINFYYDAKKERQRLVELADRWFDADGDTGEFVGTSYKPVVTELDRIRAGGR